MNAQTELLWAYYEERKQGASPESLIALRNQIARKNDKLAVAIARRMQRRCSLPLEDLIQLSRMGMLRAIPKFDPTKAAFSSFIVPYCEGEIRHFLRDRRSMVKTPRRWQEASDEARCIQMKLAKTSGRSIALEEIATKGMGLEQRQWQTIAHATQHRPYVSLDDDEAALQIAAPDDLPLEEREERERIQDAVLAALDKLPETARQCLIEKFWADLPDKIIARRHNLTPAQLQTLINQALIELRTAPC